MKVYHILCALLLISNAYAQDNLPDTLEAGWKGKAVCEVLQEDEMIRMIRCTYPPGVGQDKHFHPPYMGYVVHGGTLKSTSSSGTRINTSVAGSSFESPGVEWHELVNTGNTTVQFVVVEKKY
jgi:beta-alanine degradation protein BauB